MKSTFLYFGVCCLLAAALASPTESKLELQGKDPQPGLGAEYDVQNGGPVEGDGGAGDWDQNEAGFETSDGDNRQFRCTVGNDIERNYANVTLWKNGVVRYTISDKFIKQQNLQIRSAMKIIEQNVPCVQFRAVKKEECNTGCNFIQNSASGVCSSTVGLQLSGHGVVNLGNGCVYETIIVHELLHTLGLQHQQCRDDRDSYVKIHWNNIQKKHVINFMLYEDFKVPVEYDFHSIMHYEPNSFAIDPMKPTMTPIDKNNEIKRSKKMTEKDIRTLKYMYGCL